VGCHWPAIAVVGFAQRSSSDGPTNIMMSPIHLSHCHNRFIQRNECGPIELFTCAYGLVIQRLVWR
jgi:hypothetical protein